MIIYLKRSWGIVKESLGGAFFENEVRPISRSLTQYFKPWKGNSKTLNWTNEALKYR